MKHERDTHRQWSLLLEMTAGFACIVFLTIFVLSLAVNLYVNQKYVEHLQARQQETIDSIVSALAYQYDSENDEWNQDYIHGYGMYALSEGYILKVCDPDGAVIWDAENHDMTICHDIMTGIEALMEEYRPYLDGGFQEMAYMLQTDGTVIGSVEISCYSPYYMDENDFSFLDAVNRTLLVVGILSLLAAGTAGFLFARKFTAPIEQTIAGIRKIPEGRYDLRLSERGTSRELTELIRAVNQMAETLEQQEMLRKRLVTDVAHELRTPLTNVSAHLELMREGVWEPTPERLARCSQEIDRLTALAGELESLRQAEEENLILQPEPVEVLPLLQTVAAGYEAVAQEKNLRVEITGEAVTAILDRNKLIQAVYNLLSNAVKFTSEGGMIRLSAWAEAGSVSIAVEDSGIGIGKEDLPFIFERFYRADLSRSRKTGGAGIGLSIVKAIADAHGAEISVSSTPGQGTRFVLSGFAQEPGEGAGCGR